MSLKRSLVAVMSGCKVVLLLNSTAVRLEEEEEEEEEPPVDMLFP